MNSELEMVDIFTSGGEPTGRVELRTTAHAMGLWHRTVHVWVLNSQGELLLQQRASTKDTFPGLWDISAAGHISAGDTSARTACREVYEELGINVVAQELTLLFTLKRECVTPDNSTHDNEISDVYLLSRPVEAKCVIFDPVEVQGIKFVSIGRLQRLLKERTKLFVPHAEEYDRLFSLLAQQTGPPMAR